MVPRRPGLSPGRHGPAPAHRPVQDQRTCTRKVHGKFAALIRSSASTMLSLCNKTLYAVECTGGWIPAKAVIDNLWCAYFTYTNIYIIITLDVRLALPPSQWVGCFLVMPHFFLFFFFCPLLSFNEFQNWHFQSFFFFFFWCMLSYKWGIVWCKFLFQHWTWSMVVNKCNIEMTSVLFFVLFVCVCVCVCVWERESERERERDRLYNTLKKGQTKLYKLDNINKDGNINFLISNKILFHSCQIYIILNH